METLHICVCLHGLDGFDSDLDFIKANLQKRYKNLVLLNPKANHRATYDGILAGGKRVLAEFKETISSMQIENGYLSVIGHSLGGLYGRCFLGLLWDEGLIPSKFTPICYISLVTPHVGSREHGKILGNYITGLVLSTAIRITGAELMLCDNGNGKLPFVVELSTPKWTDVLKLFKRLVCYSNTRYDISVHYSTAAIRAPGSSFTPPEPVTVYPAILDDPNPEPIPTDASYESMILRNLLQFDWKRYAVIPSRPFLAHIDIIVKSVWLNHRHGIAIVSHIIDHFRALPSTPEVHLIIILTESNERDLLNLAEAIRDKYPRPEYKVITLNWGQKILDTLFYHISHSNAKKISIIGHGIGGLIGRWVSGFLKDIQLMNLICIDTPHISMGLPQTTFWTNKDVKVDGDDTRMADLINTEEFVESARKFKNLILYCSTNDPTLSLHSGLLLDGPDSESVQGFGSETTTIIPLEHISTSSESAAVCLPWKRFAIVQPKAVKLCLYWNEIDHPFLEHITNALTV